MQDTTRLRDVRMPARCEGRSKGTRQTKPRRPVMLMRFDPYRELDALTQAMAAAPLMNRGGVMAMDAYRDGDRFVIQLDLPGVDPDSIELTVEKNVLTVVAERNWQPSEGQEAVVNERRQGRFS